MGRKTIYITEDAKKRIFCESAKFEQERRGNASSFRKALQASLTDGNYQFDPQTHKLMIDGYTYELGKGYAETNDGEPIMLGPHTTKTVAKYIENMIGDEIYDGFSLNNEY